MWRRVRFVWFGLWVIAAGCLVAAGAFTLRGRHADERGALAGADRAEHEAARRRADDELQQVQDTLAGALERFDAAEANYLARIGERNQSQLQVDDRVAQVVGLRNGVTAEGLKILDQGTHLNELILCLKAGERTLNALSSADQATALDSLRSADAECRSSAEFLAERAQATTTSTTTAPTTTASTPDASPAPSRTAPSSTRPSPAVPSPAVPSPAAGAALDAAQPTGVTS